MNDRFGERLGLAAAGDAHGFAIWWLVESWPEAPAEWVLVLDHDGWSQMLVFSEVTNGFEFVGQLKRDGDFPGAESLQRDLRAMRMRPIEPRYQDLKIGDTRYRLVPR